MGVHKFAERWRDAVRHSVRLRRTPFHLAVLAALASPSMATLAQDAIWNGGTGNWNDSTQWDIGTVPDAGTDVRVDGGKTGTASLVNVNVTSDARNLTIDAGDRVNINNSRQLTIHGASLLNNGTLSLSSTGTATTLRVGDTTFSGTGVVSLGNSTSNRIIGIEATNVLTNAAGHTIRGSGQLGNNFMGLNNQGLIDANQSVALTIDLSDAEGVTRANSGTIQASGSGNLRVIGTALDNSGGTLQALDNATVTVTSGSRITGGTLATADNGVVLLGGNATLDTLTNLGEVRINQGNTGRIAGTVTN
ncbi:MAG: hypothetical protein EA420_01760, partial [Candidatus Competibacteraceae bacterium]